MKYFNTEGPVNQPECYRIDPLKRWDLDVILNLIDTRKYFILHAPRQTGKTSCLLALRDYLNSKGEYFALYINIEPGQAARHEVRRAIKAILGVIVDELSLLGIDKNTLDGLYTLFEQTEAESGLLRVLSYLSTNSQKPIVLFIDEIDSLVGDSLVSVLRQLRSGYSNRPVNFPSSVILCGIRNIHDYRIHTSGQDIITGGSAFNIKAESLRLDDFTKDEVIELYTQHTKETGQIWADGCFDLVMKYTDGQPWLVNALAHCVTFRMKENRDPAVVITPQMIDTAKERLILSGQTHLYQLAYHLKEDRVRRVIQPLILGEESSDQLPDDLQYCVDLGLIKKSNGTYIISNRIYAEVIPRELTQVVQSSFVTRFTAGWLNKDGSLNIHKLLTMFKDFWIENSKIWRPELAGYTEAAPHLVIQAFLQRILNGDGAIFREYSFGRNRFDIYITWNYDVTSGTKTKTQQFLIELKTIKAGQKYTTLKKNAIDQTAEYAHTCGISENAHIIFFNRDFQDKWHTKAPNEKITHDGVKLEIWKM